MYAVHRVEWEDVDIQKGGAFRESARSVAPEIDIVGTESHNSDLIEWPMSEEFRQLPRPRHSRIVFQVLQ